MKIFISHTTEESGLAEAWKRLLQHVIEGCEVWYSSDFRSHGGMEPKPWRQQVRDQLGQSGVVLALVTPESHARPWIIYECGFAQGLSADKRIIPVVYFMKPENVSEVLRDQNAYSGDLRDRVKILCGRLIALDTMTRVTTNVFDSWEPALDLYMGQVHAYNMKRLGRSLFDDAWHNNETAEKMKGPWFAKWMQQHDDGTEDVFEVDTVDVWPTDFRIRFVGTSAKKGLKDKTYYPMEGVVSSAGDVVLSYWSEPDKLPCGVVLLERVTGAILEGHWQGFTSRDIRKRRQYTRGRVVIARDKEIVDDYFSEAK